MKVIGLTGGIASGKSTVSKILRAESQAVVDADLLAREVVASGTFGLGALVKIFGSGILTRDGDLDRKKLGEKLFSDPECRRIVENITHPLIQWRAQQEFDRLKKEGRKIAFYDAALIFEKNLQSHFDGVIVVHTPEPIQVKRLMERENLDQKAAEERVRSQMPMGQKVAKADFVIDNSGSIEETAEQVRALLKKL